MSTAIVEAEKKAAFPLDAELQAPIAPDVAVSVRASWDAVSKMTNVNVPLRRPKRAVPSRELVQELADIEFAKQALADKDGVIPYGDFRSEIMPNG